MTHDSAPLPPWAKKLRARVRTTHLTEASRDDLLYAGYDAATLARRPFINVGAGKFAHHHWTNVDYGTDWYAKKQPKGFVHYDLTALTPLPFDDASLELVYTSHTIEHVPPAAAHNLFREAHRVLRPGGGLRITCPDAALLFRAAHDGRLGYWSFRHRWFLGPLSTAPSLEAVTVWDYLAREIATRRCRFYRHAEAPVEPSTMEEWARSHGYRGCLDRLGEGLAFDPRFPGDHIAWWDEDKLMEALREAGFTNVYRSRRGQSLFAPMTDGKRFDSTQPYLSLYVEAVR